MTPADAAKILAVAAIFDRRTIGTIEAAAWAEALDDLDPKECAEAVRAHYRDTTTWLMPAHVRGLVAQRHRVDATQARRHNVLAELEQAKAESCTEAAEQAKRDARAAFDAALEAKHAADCVEVSA